MKTLLVSYLPSGAYSHTQRLLTHFTRHVPAGTLEHLDLLTQPAPAHSEASMQAYFQRNFRGEALSPAMVAAIAPHDALVDQLLAADILVLAHPLHNFALPGPIKLWLDAVLQKGKAFDYLPEQVGLLQSKKALALYSSAGQYEGTPFAYRDTLPDTYNAIFSYTAMGEYDIIGANRAVALGTEAEAQVLCNAETRLTAVAHRWYGAPAAPMTAQA